MNSEQKTFSTPAIAIIVVLLIALGIVFFLYWQESQKSTDKNLFAKNVPSFSSDKNLDRIKFSLAKKCKKEFSKITFKFLFTDDGGKTDLTGWKIDMGDLRKFIDNVPNVHELFLTPAMKPTINPSNGNEEPSTEYITLLVMGLDTSDTQNGPKIIYDPLNNEPYIFEYISPCPPKCPKNYGIVFP